MTDKDMLQMEKARIKYLNNRRRRIKARLHLLLGFEQTILHPYYIFFLLLVSVPFVIAWNNVDSFLPVEFIPHEWLTPCRIIISALLLITLILFELLTVQVIGNLKARYPESNLHIVFPNTYECPILRSYKFDKQSQTLVLEFYSEIPMKEWENKMEHIAELNDAHFVTPHITYGGKHNNKGRYIKLYMQKGILPPERGTMHDKEL